MISNTGPEAKVSYDQIVRALNLFCGDLTEIRLLDCHGSYGRPYVISGYFDRDHFEQAAAELVGLDDQFKPKGIYFIFNEINPGCHARAYNRFQHRPAVTTTDGDIVSRRWIYVDVDPKRPSGVSATGEEKHQAIEAREAIFERLREFAEPVVCDSGNGWHLYIPVDLPNDAESLATVKRLLLGMQSVWPAVDISVSNASRIAKLYGTVGRKGDSTPERPHRKAEIIYVPDYLENGWSIQ